MKTPYRIRLFFILFFALSFRSLGAAEYIDGRLKLVLHEPTGRFSLYYLTDILKERYEPLFVDQDPRTTFITIMTGNRTYRLGETASFKIRLNGTSNPGFTFESSFLSVVQEFSFIKTAGSSLANGVRMNIRIENRGEQQLTVGLRFLLDTSLGEGRSVPHFTTDSRSFTVEALVDGGNSDRWWVSRNARLGFMGNIFVGGITRPDNVHFANWKRLNDVPWKMAYARGRNFNLLPYSVEDSAVCYYFDPVPLSGGEGRDISILLAAEDENGFAQYNTTVDDDLTRILQKSAEISTGISTGKDNYLEEDVLVLRDLLNRIDQYITTGSVTEEELMTIELILARLKARHSP
jgi:hypothetical protein